MKNSNIKDTAANPPDEDDDLAAFPLFRAATHYETLAAAWRKVEANNGACGGDGVTVGRFAAFADRRLSRLAHELREGLYRPGPSRRVYAPKKSGGLRPLDIPCVIDRVAQAATALTLLPLIEKELEDSTFAYRPGRSVAQAVARVGALRRQGYSHVVDGDIVRFFERIDHARLIGQLETLTRDARLVDLIALWLEWHAPDGKGVPQGSPLSPLLANLYLDAVDEAIQTRGVRLVRYADDFVLMCKGEAAAAGALTRMRDLLDEHGLELHAEKTRIVDFDSGLRFLGHVFVRSMIWREVETDEGDDLVAAAERMLALGRDPPEAGAPPEADETTDKAPRGRWATGQRVLYMIEPGRTLACEGETFSVRDGETVVLRLPQNTVDRIEIGPGARVETEALDLAAASDTRVVRVNGYGETLGVWTPPFDSGRAQRHLAQAAVALNAQARHVLARTIVGGRIRNQQILLKRLNRTRKDPALAAAAVKIARMERQLLNPRLDIAGLMGHEGQAAAVYWPALGGALDASWGFSGRRLRRVRADPFNVALDILANMLERDISVAVDRQNLHAGIGVLHAPQTGAEPLVYDLMEEFRAPVIEACAMALFGRRALRADMFAREKDGSCVMSRDGWRAVIRGYEAWLARDITHPADGGSMLWRRLFERQAAGYAHYCETGEPYEPYRMDY